MLPQTAERLFLQSTTFIVLGFSLTPHVALIRKCGGERMSIETIALTSLQNPQDLIQLIESIDWSNLQTALPRLFENLLNAVYLY